MSYPMWAWEKFKIAYEYPIVKSGVPCAFRLVEPFQQQLLFSKLLSVFVEKGKGPLQNYFKESLVTGKEGEESLIIGTSFEQEYGLVSQTYNTLLFTHTIFVSNIKANIYII